MGVTKDFRKLTKRIVKISTNALLEQQDVNNFVKIVPVTTAVTAIMVTHLTMIENHA